MAASIEIMEGEEKDAEEEEFGSLEEVCPEDPRTNLYLSMGGFHVQSVTHPPFGGLVTKSPKDWELASVWTGLCLKAIRTILSLVARGFGPVVSRTQRLEQPDVITLALALPFVCCVLLGDRQLLQALLGTYDLAFKSPLDFTFARFMTDGGDRDPFVGRKGNYP